VIATLAVVVLIAVETGGNSKLGLQFGAL